MELNINLGTGQDQSGRSSHFEEKSIAPMASFLKISGVGSVKEQIKELEVRIAQKSEDMLEQTTTILKAGEILIGNESEMEALIGDVKANITKVSSQVEKISTLHDSLLKTRPLLETVSTSLRMKQSEVVKLKDEVQHLKGIEEENDTIMGKQLATDMLMTGDSLFQVIKEIEKEKYELQVKCDNLQKELTESQLSNMKQVSRWRLENVQNLKSCAELKQTLSQKCTECEELKTKCQLFEKQLLNRGKEESVKTDNMALSTLQNSEAIKADNVKLMQEKNSLQILIKSKEAMIAVLQEKLAEAEAKVNALHLTAVGDKVIKSENSYNDHCMEKMNFINGHKNGFNDNQTVRNIFTLMENKCGSEVTETFTKNYQQKLEDLQFENEKLHKEVLLYRSQVTGVKIEQFSDSSCSESEVFRYETKKQNSLNKEIEQQIVIEPNNPQESLIQYNSINSLKAAEMKIYALNNEVENLRNEKERCVLIISRSEKQLKELLCSDKDDIVSLVNEIEFKWTKLNDLVLFLERKLHSYMDNVDINENKCIPYFTEAEVNVEAALENALVPYNAVEHNLGIVAVDELASDTTISHSQYYDNNEILHDENEAKSLVLSFQEDKGSLLQLDTTNSSLKEVNQVSDIIPLQKEEPKPVVNVTTRRFRGILATKRRWFPCTVCGKKLTTKANLKTHLKLHSGERPFQCDICNKTFITKATLYTHRRIHTGDRPFECNVCNKRFSSKSSLYMHQRIHTGIRPFKCNICKKAFVAKATLQNHQKTHSGERPYQCDLCMKSFTFLLSLQLHRRIHTGEKPHSCDLCGKKFARGSSLHAHRKHHTGEKPYKCEFCEKAFIAFSNLAAHRRVHTGERPYRCHICAKTFASRGNLHVHVKIHSGEKPHKCDICMKAFSQRGALRDHKRIHTGEKPYTCETCGKKVATSSLLYSHRMTHSDKRPYQCNICLKTYKTNTNLQEHKRIHTGERPYNCNICGKTFAAKSSLYTHKITHTGERPFNCSICGKSFATKSTLYTHKMIHTGERPYQCNVCGKNLASKSSLYTHNMIHTGEKPYECDICMKRFRQLGNLQAHRNIHLPD